MMKRFVHGGNIYEDIPADGWLDFSANINPLGLPASAREAIALHIGDVIHYPDPAARRLRQALSSSYDVAPDALVLGNGAAELFYLFFQTFRPQRTILPVPSFSEYERAALAAGSSVTYFQLDAQEDFRLDGEKLRAALPEQGCAVVGNPNNPTGTLLTREELMQLADAAAARKTWLLVDESFLDFLPDDAPYSLLDAAAEKPYLFVIRSLTKFFALPGLRLGFGAASPSAVQAMERGKDVWNVNLLAQEAGAAALQDHAYAEESRGLVAEERRFLCSRLASLPGVRVYPTQVNFLLLDIRGTHLSSTELTARMRREGVLIRDCGNYPGLDGRSYVRLAVRQHEENVKLLERLETILL